MKSHQILPTGFFDALRGRSLLGWAWQADRPQTRVAVRALVDGQVVAEAVADIHRPDLQDAGYGDGRHSFTLVLPLALMDGAEHLVAVQTADGIDLNGSPQRLRLPDLQYRPLPPDDAALPGELAICAIAKNEGPYLLEWIAFHRVVGVEYFLIFDNDSSDETAHLLAPLAAAGLVAHVPWPSQARTPPQLPAYEEGIRRLRDRYRWLAFIDLDEFLHPLEGDDIRPLLRLYGGAGGLVVPWRIFGSGGAVEAEDELVIRRFTRRAPAEDPVNHAVKSIVRGQLVAVAGVHAPHLRQGQLVDEALAVAGSAGDPDRHPVPEASRLVLHHYFCKSRAEWERKRQRGRATRSAGDPSFIRPDHVFHAHDRNEVEDRHILRFEAAVRAEMRRLADLSR